MKISILKNGTEVKSFTTNKFNYNRTFAKAVDYAGGLWNGVDKFTVKGTK